jgi:UDP-N-acetylglucosamine--N-acetylmuramyl-(pentapeptide) pyrophosphoryl-undecaprenol N-acetylglucosamine transferase
MTNKFLSKYVDAVCISFPDTKVKAKKVVYTGNPSREDDNSIFDKKEFKLSDDKKLVLIVMGSLGSKVVNDKMKEILPKFNDKNYEVLFITGNDYYEEFNNLKLNKNIKIVPFINNLKRVFKKTDVLVTRAGATTMSEIISFKVP